MGSPRRHGKEDGPRQPAAARFPCPTPAATAVNRAGRAPSRHRSPERSEGRSRRGRRRRRPSGGRSARANAEADPAKYRSSYGLSSRTTSNGRFKKVSRTGSTGSPPSADSGRAEEPPPRGPRRRPPGRRSSYGVTGRPVHLRRHQPARPSSAASTPSPAPRRTAATRPGHPAGHRGLPPADPASTPHATRPPRHRRRGLVRFPSPAHENIISTPHPTGRQIPRQVVEEDNDGTTPQVPVGPRCPA